MTSCDTLDLIGYMEGQDPDGKIKGHLETCEQCRKDLKVYEKLLGGLVGWRKYQLKKCAKLESTLERGLQNMQPDAGHLSSCKMCRELHTALVDALEGIEAKAEAIDAPLPSSIAEMVVQRKKRWTSGKMGNVLDFHGIKDERAREARVKKIMDADSDGLPKAAFPEGLTGRKDEEEDDDKE